MTDAAAAGSITIERRPGAGGWDARAMLRDVLGTIPGPTATASGPRAILTDGGDLGAILTVRGTQGERIAAVVFAPAETVRASADVRDSADVPRVRRAILAQLGAHDVGQAGRDRRLVPYAPPPGWASRPGRGETVWVSPEAGGSRSFIRALDARLGTRREAPRAGRRIHGRDGLVADVATYVAGERVVSDFTASDEQYLYAFRLETDGKSFAETSKAFAGMLASLRPLARRRVTNDVFAAWAE